MNVNEEPVPKLSAGKGGEGLYDRLFAYRRSAIVGWPFVIYVKISYIFLHHLRFVLKLTFPTI